VRSNELRGAFFSLLFDRRTIPVKWFMRGLTVLLLCGGTLGTPGCGPDNDTEANQLGKTLGDPGKPNAGSTATTTEAPPKTPQEFAERQKERQKQMLEKGGYAGSKK
jgi:hypothetical protein